MCEEVGVNAAFEVPEPLLMLTGGLDVDDPFCRQDQVTGSLLASVMVAFRLMVAPAEIVLPVAEGDCAQVGGEFFTTVQICEVVPEELDTSAFKTFEPTPSSVD